MPVLDRGSSVLSVPPPPRNKETRNKRKQVKSMSSDLQVARSESTINASRIGDLLFDPGYRETRTRIAAILEQEPVLEKSQR